MSNTDAENRRCWLEIADALGIPHEQCNHQVLLRRIAQLRELARQPNASTETITWVPVEQAMPDDDRLVLLELRDENEPVWIGLWNGEMWCDLIGMPMACKVSAWTYPPAGRAR